MKRKGLLLGAALVVVLLAVPIASNAANTGIMPLGDQISGQMQEMKQSSWELRKTADRLHAITRGGGHTWQTHSSYLTTAKENVNQLGKMLASMEDFKQHGTKLQQRAIECMRPQLVQTAMSLTRAIDLLNDRRQNVYFSDYREQVQAVSEQSESLHELLDAVLKYEAAKARVEGLELEPTA